MTKLTIGLEGGLGNRMRVAASTVALAPHVQGDVAILWTKQWGMECRFDSLFMPFAQDNVVLRDATFTERIKAARPRPRNRLIAKTLNRIFYNDVIYNDSVTALCDQGFDFVRWANSGPVLMWTWWNFYPYPTSLLANIFQPLPHIKQRIDERTADFAPHTIGLHIRRTDNIESIKESPTQLFYDAVDKELEANPSTHIYLATDDQYTKQLFAQRYGSQRITTAHNQASRNNTQGIEDAVVEMYALSRVNHIFGSAGSSFSTIAASLGDAPITILRATNKEQLVSSANCSTPKT